MCNSQHYTRKHVKSRNDQVLYYKYKKQQNPHQTSAARIMGAADFIKDLGWAEQKNLAVHCHVARLDHIKSRPALLLIRDVKNSQNEPVLPLA